MVTNDSYTAEDTQFLVRNEALPPERIVGAETGGCPHTAIREDASINLETGQGLEDIGAFSEREGMLRAG